MRRTRQELEELKQERIKRVVYAGLSLVVTGVAVWRMVNLLIHNTADAAIILACIVMWQAMRLDIYLPMANIRKEETNERDCDHHAGEYRRGETR